MIDNRGNSRTNVHADEVAHGVVLAQDGELAGVGDLGVLLVRDLLRALGQQVRLAPVRRVHLFSSFTESSRLPASCQDLDRTDACRHDPADDGSSAANAAERRREEERETAAIASLPVAFVMYQNARRRGHPCSRLSANVCYQLYREQPVHLCTQYNSAYTSNLSYFRSVSDDPK